MGTVMEWKVQSCSRRAQSKGQEWIPIQDSSASSCVGGVDRWETLSAWKLRHRWMYALDQRGNILIYRGDRGADSTNAVRGRWGSVEDARRISGVLERDTVLEYKLRVLAA